MKGYMNTSFKWTSNETANLDTILNIRWHRMETKLLLLDWQFERDCVWMGVLIKVKCNYNRSTAWK